MQTSEPITELAKAMVKAQSKLRAVKQDSTNPHFRNRYTSLKAFIEACRPVLTECGIAVIQMPISGEGTVGVRTRLVHESGEWVEDECFVPIGETKNPAQAAGSIITYLRRYAYTAAIGVAPGEEDDDAEDLSQSPFPDDEPGQETGGGEAAMAMLEYVVKLIGDGDLTLARHTLGSLSSPIEDSAARVMQQANETGKVGRDELKAFSKEWHRLDRQLTKLEQQS